jgi:hypothetical protein
MAAHAKTKEAYIASLAAGAITFPRLVIGILEEQPLAVITASRVEKRWPAREGNSIEVRAADIIHQLKRLSEGLTPAEMWTLVECVLHPKAIAKCDPSGRCILLYFEQIEFEPGRLFTPQGIVMDGLDWKAPRLYGLIPKGWAGRK